MYMIAGLGNPTGKYAKTRHNVGFDTIAILADRMRISVEIEKHKALSGRGMIGSEKVILLKPQTYMNLSGESIRAAIDFYKINPKEELIVIYDDISLDVGQLRIRTKGSAGGHNGIKSIISCLGTDEFKRIKIGVGEKPKGWDLSDYVLARFSESERLEAEVGMKQAALAAECIILEGIQAAMNQYNGSRKPSNSVTSEDK